MIITFAASVVLFLAFIFSMLGLGGAMLYVPLFHIFGFNFKAVAIPTGLLLNMISSVSASSVYLRSKMVDIKGAIPLIVSAFIGAPVGAYLTRMVPTRVLILLFSIAMLFVGGRMLFVAASPEKQDMMQFRNRFLLMGMGGFAIGLIAGLLGVGGGFLFAPLMLAIGYPTKRAAATSSFVVIFSSFSGFTGHVAEGHLNWPLMISTAVAVLIGSQIGAKVMKEKMKAKWIKQLYAIVLLAVAAQLLFKLYASRIL
ncbi:MAG: sulfite exporter TauE/SafE family protein [Nitrospiraceae bacterium]|nr:sulfite exporter TauE/SafE family protein [Nitrospiraceae bacterium]